MSKKNWISGNLKLSVKGEPLEVPMAFPAKPVRPQRILPILQKITNGFVEIGVKEAARQGESVSCTKGCGACCRQIVPLSEIEVYHIAELVENMPAERRRKVEERFEEANRHFHESGLYERIDDKTGFSAEEIRELGTNYFQEKFPCPFLEEEACSIHPDRPLICREYLVTSAAEICGDPSPEKIKTVEIPHKMSWTLLKIWRANYSPQTTFIPLVRALEWAKTHPEKSRRKLGTAWMDEVIQSISTKSKKEATNNR